MRVRHLLIVGLALALSLVVGRLIILEAHTRQAKQLDLLQSSIARVSLDSASLLVLGQDYLLSASPRAIRQWRAVHAELTQILPSAASQSMELKDDINTLKEVAAELPLLFDALLSAASEADRAQSQPRVDMLAGHLVAETRRISDGAFDLAEKLADIRRARAEVERDVTRATMAVFGMVFLVFAWVSRRRLLRPLEYLEAVARAVQSGALAARSGYRAKDEFGDLSAAFDQMAQSLEANFLRLSHSESSLQAAQRDLRTILDRETQDRLRLAAALRENEALLSTIHRHSIVSVTDATGRIIEANDNFCGISGYRREELLGHTHQRINSGLHAAAFWDRMWLDISAGLLWRDEVCNRAKDGSLYWVDSVVAPFLGEDGRVEKYISIRTDITSRKHAETLLQKVYDRFEIAADSANIGVWEFEVATRTLLWDERMYRLYQRERTTDVEPYTLWSLSVHPDDRQYSEDVLAQALRGEREFDLEFRIVRPSGEVRHLKASARVLRDGSGQPLRMTGVNIDITDRKRAELELLETSALLRTVLESASEVSIIATDAELTVRVFNSGAQRLLGYSEAEVVGKLTLRSFHTADEVDLRVGVATLRKEQDCNYVRKDGSVVPVSLVVTAMHTESGAPLGYLAVASDVTRQIQHEQSLREAVDKAEQASLAKSQFLANMSHEIRTPMNAVVGLSHVLGRTALDAEQSDCLAKIKSASKSLMAVINDVLDLSKIEAGELLLESRPFSMPDLLRDMVDVMSVHAQAKGFVINLETPPELPYALVGDATRLRQILSNLLSNAVKFTNHGGVVLRIQCLDDVADQVWIRFSVHDTGIGIAPDVQTRLFKPFAQADASTTRRFGGTGLGLSIVKRLSDLMGGRLGLVSNPDLGSEFWVELGFQPASPSDASAMLLTSAPSLGERSLLGLRVLVVDDSTINLDVARRILELEGAQVAIAINGQLALDYLAAAPEGFDIVLMDVQMPVLDGYAATRRIRTELGLAALPIIALTAGAMTSERSNAIGAGMDAFISKPFDAEALVRTVARHAMQRQAARGVQLPLPPVPSIQPAGTWPDIEGIDASDVRARLNNDVDLFASMLRRLLDEFCSGDAGLALEDPGQLPEHAARLHKLRGSAGMLGAKAIHQLATAAEAACRAGLFDQARRITVEIATNLARLRRCTAQLIARSPQDEAGMDSGDAAAMLDPSSVRELAKLLRQQSFKAIERFGSMAPDLQRKMGPQVFDQLRNRLDAMQFKEAADLVEGLGPSVLRPIVLDAAQAPLPDGRSAGHYGGVRLERLPQAAAYQASLLAGRRNAALACVTEAMDSGASLVQASVRIVQPALYAVGELWQKNRISVAQEHLASAISQNVMVGAYMRASFAPSVGKSAVFACVEGNHHGLGLRMVSDAFETHGWDAAFLGTDIPLADLVRDIDRRRPDLLALSAALPWHLGTARDTITALRAELGNACPQIWIGGMATLSSEKAWRFTLADHWASDALNALEHL